ncbi:hypothetical protein [Acidipila sp. EB88]|uniref:hypothetical protein n=1 Tax=Acidipila sp. EB88 TaxID=2305226 RepID=UPI000F5FB5BF|nr:hypothetical protein [Acidipila sp. EB88]RRA47549.1 hypothetical protein D1Y84_03785 [Acidipila sp. EB88]
MPATRATRLCTWLLTLLTLLSLWQRPGWSQECTLAKPCCAMHAMMPRSASSALPPSRSCSLCTGCAAASAYAAAAMPAHDQPGMGPCNRGCKLTAAALPVRPFPLHTDTPRRMPGDTAMLHPAGRGNAAVLRLPPGESAHLAPRLSLRI